MFANNFFIVQNWQKKNNGSSKRFMFESNPLANKRSKGGALDQNNPRNIWNDEESEMQRWTEPDEQTDINKNNQKHTHTEVISSCPSIYPRWLLHDVNLCSFAILYTYSCFFLMRFLHSVRFPCHAVNMLLYKRYTDTYVSFDTIAVFSIDSLVATSIWLWKQKETCFYRMNEQSEQRMKKWNPLKMEYGKIRKWMPHLTPGKNKYTQTRQHRLFHFIHSFYQQIQLLWQLFFPFLFIFVPVLQSQPIRN